MILALAITPAMQRVMLFHRLTVNQVNRAITTLDGPAGKGVNVAKALAELGESVALTGFIGGDRGDTLQASLRDRKINLDFIRVPQRTRECVTVIDESAGTQTELVEESAPVHPAEYEALAERVRCWTPQCQAVMLCGTLTPGGPITFYRDCIERARSHRALTLLDAQTEPLMESLTARPGIVKPNRAELSAALGRTLPDEAAVRIGMRELHERGAQRVVVTDGAEPIQAFDGRSFWRIYAPRVKVVNPIGSGDVFAATLVSRLLQGEDLSEACRWASAAGAANALNVMAGEFRRADLDRLVRETRAES